MQMQIERYFIIDAILFIFRILETLETLEIRNFLFFFPNVDSQM